jgi:hypothetical protein
METKEPQYNEIENIVEKYGISNLGLMVRYLIVIGSEMKA